MAESEDPEQDAEKSRSGEEPAEPAAERDESAESDEEPAEHEEPDDDEDEDEDEDEDDERPRERLAPEALIDRYRPAGLAAGTPWTWSSLSPTETGALVEMIDSFVADYNEVWSLTDDDTIPPCWHRHPALAHDLAALAWAFYQAYLDPTATPDLALRFQANLPKFRGRIDDWLGADPAACRDNSHSRTWRRSTRPAPPAATRESSEERDAVVLLGYRLWGFPRPQSQPPPD